MGKRSHEERSKKKSKQSDENLETSNMEEAELIEDEVLNNQEDIMLEMNDEIDCVEVEITDDQQIMETDLLQPMSTQLLKPNATKKTTTPTKQANLGDPLLLATLNAKKSNKKRRESDTSSDEERWLTAIETGKLDDVDDELKKMKDPKLMTARQRAMYERGLDKDPDSPGADLLMSLPIGSTEKPQTAEDVRKRALKILRRKQMADEKREKDKRKTIERLLNKKETNKQRSTVRSRAATKVTVPMISYRNTPTGAFIEVPQGFKFPLKKVKAREPAKKILCGIVGCNNPKVYNCSKTNIPLCSLSCYQKNVQAVRQIMC